MTKKQIEAKKQQIEKLQKEVAELERDLQNKPKWLKIPELKIEVEIKVHDKGKSWNDLNLLMREDELLTIEECNWLANSKYAKELKMDGSSEKDNFFIKQFFDLNRKRDFVARFDADSGGAYFDCYWFPSFSNASLGVRFKRRLK